MFFYYAFYYVFYYVFFYLSLMLHIFYILYHSQEHIHTDWLNIVVPISFCAYLFL